MATRLQKKLAQAIASEPLDQRPKTAGQLLETAGYGIGTQTGSPGRTLEAPGVTEELMKLGFSVQEADNQVAKILTKGRSEKNRLGAADRVYKRFGAFAPERQDIRTVNINITPEKKEQVDKALDLYFDAR